MRLHRLCFITFLTVLLFSDRADAITVLLSDLIQPVPPDSLSIAGVEFFGFQHRDFSGQRPPTPGIDPSFDIFQNRAFSELPPSIPSSLLTVEPVLFDGRPALRLGPFVSPPGTSSLTQISFSARTMGPFFTDIKSTAELLFPGGSLERAGVQPYVSQTRVFDPAGIEGIIIPPDPERRLQSTGFLQETPLQREITGTVQGTFLTEGLDRRPELNEIFVVTTVGQIGGDLVPAVGPTTISTLTHGFGIIPEPSTLTLWAIGLTLWLLIQVRRAILRSEGAPRWFQNLG